MLTLCLGQNVVVLVRELMVLFHPDARDSWSPEVIGSVAVYVIICSEVTTSSILEYHI